MKGLILSLAFLVVWPLSIANALELKAKQSTLKGLLVQPLSGGNFAGKHLK